MTTTDPLQTETLKAKISRAVQLNMVILADRGRDEVDTICSTEGITRAQYAVLFVMCLTDAPEGVPTGALADGLVTRQPDVTRLVDRLVRNGLAERRPAPHDRRVVLVSPTAEGRAAFERVTPKLQAYHERQWSHLSDDELDQLNRLLAKALWGNQ